MTLDEVLSQMKNRTNLGINRYGTTLVRESTMRAWTAALESVKNTTLKSDYDSPALTHPHPKPKDTKCRTTTKKTQT